MDCESESLQNNFTSSVISEIHMDHKNFSLKSVSAMIEKTQSQISLQSSKIPVTFIGANPFNQLLPGKIGFVTVLILIVITSATLTKLNRLFLLYFRSTSAYISGRRRCQCQAQVHKLIRNCMGCGRIVCAQEGSGPCMFCKTLVCTREERRILDMQTEESAKLYKKLVGDVIPTFDKNRAIALSPSHKESFAKAEQDRDRLLRANADKEMRRRIHDLDSDYFSMESDIYLTKEEREAIVKRKKELKEIRKHRNRAVVVDFDFDKGITKKTECERDPVLEAILESSYKRQEVKPSKLQLRSFGGFVPKVKNPELPCQTDGFVKQEMNFLSNELQYVEVAKKGYSIALMQPVATLLAHGFRRHIFWNEYVDIRGPILIVAKTISVSNDQIEKEMLRFTKDVGNREFPSDFPQGGILGRALLIDCVALEDYEKDNADDGYLDEEGSYVLIFDIFEPLNAVIPHIPPSDGIYVMKKHLVKIVEKALNFSLSSS
ncbi:unnamed protein product [Thelazia callipaeda]|uniref:Zf-C2HC5 domain-containing protein n=1 Tax=Thelazia callipaeda TaxID=103827 RepID=A0A0N5D7M9_THECL|nr:unnamed protein product [Thelazia callipaeda]